MDQYWARPDMFDNSKQGNFQHMRQESNSYNMRQESYHDPRQEMIRQSRSEAPQELRQEYPQDLRPEPTEMKRDIFQDRNEITIKEEIIHSEQSIQRHENVIRERTESIKKEEPESQKDPLSFKPPIEMICQFCGSDFDDLDNLIGHVHLHLESMPDCDVNLRCMIKGCSYRPKTSTKRTDNISEESGPQNLITKYTQLKSIQDHMRSRHLNMPAWKCMFCDKPFNSKASLDYHIRMHNDPSKEYCRICKHFKSADKIASHDLIKCAKLANAERKYECEDCGKRFKGAANLSLHKIIHSEERFMCDFCGKSFTQKGNRKTHIMKKHSAALIQQSLIINNEIMHNEIMNNEIINNEIINNEK
jgi:rubrerythrin